MMFKRKKDILMTIWIVLVAVISLAYYWCMVDCPYRGDDCLNVNAGIGNIYYSGESIGELTVRIFKSWLAAGRFFPFAMYTYYLFAVFHTLHSYRIFLFCITLIMVLLSGLIIKKLTDNYLMTASFISLTPMMFYLSEYSACNPLLCYQGLMQITVIWFLCSAYCLLQWMDTDKRIYAIFSAIFYFISLSTYEVAYVFIVFIAFAVLYKESNIRSAIRKMMPILVAYGGGIIINVLLRVSAAGGYAGVEMAFSISKVANTVLCMMAAAFPIYNAFSTGYTFELGDITKSSAVLSIIFAVIFVMTFNVFKEKQMNKRERIIIYCMGASLWILPAFLVSMSARYQNEIRWGTDWLPYFAEVIGTSIIFVQFCRDLYGAIANSTGWKWMRHIVSLCLCILIGYMALWNRTAAEHSYSKTEMNGFYTIQNALESGILEELSDKDIIHVVQTVGSEGEPNVFYSRFAKKRCNADVLISDEQYNATDYSAYEREFIAKKLQLEDDGHIFVVGTMKPGALNLVSFPLVFIPNGESNETVTFLIGTNGMEEYKEIASSDICKTLSENGIIVQLPYENVILDSIGIKFGDIVL